MLNSCLKRFPATPMQSPALRGQLHGQKRAPSQPDPRPPWAASVSHTAFLQDSLSNRNYRFSDRLRLASRGVHVRYQGRLDDAWRYPSMMPLEQFWRQSLARWFRTSHRAIS